MFARIAVWEPMPDDDRQWVIDAAKAVPGVRDNYHPVDPSTGNGLSIVCRRAANHGYHWRVGAGIQSLCGSISPVSVSVHATSRSLTFSCCEVRFKISNASSGDTLSRSIRMPFACPITSRDNRAR